MRGLWSENIVTSVAKTKFLNFLKVYITANASLSIVDIADWVAVSLQLAKAMGFSRLPSVHCIRQQPRAILEASTNYPQGLPNSKVCNLVALHKLSVVGGVAQW